MLKNLVKVFILSFVMWHMLHNKAICQEMSITEGVRIAWDYSSMQQIAEKGGYPRLTRLKDSTLIVIYETRTGNIHLKKSIDNGITWSAPEEVFSKFVYASLDGKSTVVNIANPEIKQLQNGDIIIACNYRPVKAEIAPYTIVIRRSLDNAKTWLSPQNLYTAAPRFVDGCWEPSFLQLPNGELQVYFANENPYKKSDEQEISMVSSLDNGITWSQNLKTVSFRKDRRDGMPVPQIIGDEIVMIIEDNNIDRFKPYTVRTKISDNWSKPVLANSSNRDYSLVKHVQDSIYMGAPYFIKLPNGETLISYQTNENRSNNWELSTLEVAVGNTSAKKFGRITQPFPVPYDKEAKWNSLALWDNQTVVALASSNFKSKEVAPWLIKGHIIPPISLKQENYIYPIFIGAKGYTNLKAGINADKSNIYIESIIKEVHQNNFSEVFFFLKLNDQSFKIWCDKNGNVEMWSKRNNVWITSNLKNKIEINTDPTPKGYKLKLAIQKNIISQKTLKNFRLGIGLSAIDEQQNKYIEYLSNMEIDAPETWLNVEL